MADVRWESPPGKWGLRAGRSPQKHDSLAGVVPVAWGGGEGYAYIRFNQPMVNALAKRMQYGMSPLHPCYLRVFHVKETGVWRLFCMYLGRKVGVMLHEYNERPEWLPIIHRREEDVESAQASAQG